MQVTAKLNYLRIAPRKVRLVADLVRGKRVEEARTILGFTPKRAAPVLLKLLESAVANAKNDFQLDADRLYLKKLVVDEGPKLKRWRPRARGQAYEIQKKSSHITLVLAEEGREEGVPEKARPKKEKGKAAVTHLPLKSKEAKPSPDRGQVGKKKEEKERGIEEEEEEPEKKEPEKRAGEREEAKRSLKQRPKPWLKRERRRPAIGRGIRRVFRRKAF